MRKKEFSRAGLMTISNIIKAHVQFNSSLIGVGKTAAV